MRIRVWYVPYAYGINTRMVENSYTSSTYFSITENDTTGEPGHLVPIQRQLRASCASIGLGRSRDPS